MRHHAACGGEGRQGRAWTKGGGPHDQRVALNTRMWPGITRWGGSCTCTRADYRGVYQVKVRNTSCPEHGGDLALVLARMERAS